MKYGKEITDEICKYLQGGSSNRDAAALVGITEETFYQWVKKPEFSEAIKKAEGAAAVKWLRVIEAAGKESWQAMAWKLERRYPRDYGRQVQEHVGDAGQPIILKVTYGERTNNTPPPTTPETSAGD